MVVFSQSGCIRARWLYSGKMVVLGKISSIWENWLYLGERCFFGCIRAKISVIRVERLYSGKVLVLAQNVCIRAKVVVFG